MKTGPVWASLASFMRSRAWQPMQTSACGYWTRPQAPHRAPDAAGRLGILAETAGLAPAAVEPHVLLELLPLDVRGHRLAADVGRQHAARAQPALVRLDRHAAGEALGERHRPARGQRVGGAEHQR